MMPTFVFSLDFELMWGVRDHSSVSHYGDAVLGVRRALPRILKLFDEYGVSTTWATVGLLFARNRKEMLDFFPDVQPSYKNPKLCPLDDIRHRIGENEATDPYHFGRSLVDQLLENGRQEIATHTYTHYYCLEEGETAEAFESDLKSAIAISSAVGVRPRSIVFPRNQMTAEHVAACKKQGILSFRGNPSSFMYKARVKKDQGLCLRGLRMVDAHFPIVGKLSYQKPNYVAGCSDVCASRFFRPYSPRLGIINDLHILRIVNEMKYAAAQGETYHLWCHPHNFGRNTDVQIDRLERILITFRYLRDAYGMESKTMLGCVPGIRNKN